MVVVGGDRRVRKISVVGERERAREAGPGHTQPPGEPRRVGGTGWAAQGGRYGWRFPDFEHMPTHSIFVSLWAYQ